MSIARVLAQHRELDTASARCVAIRDALIRDGLYAESAEATTGTRWRLAPEPFLISAEDLASIERLGDHLLAFYRAFNQLYLDSIRGAQPAWVAAYLDQGKPESLITYSRMKRWRDHLPAVIRPDMIPTADGMVITELDSVPGGIGLTGALGRAYGQISGQGLVGSGQCEEEKTEVLTTLHRPRTTDHMRYDIVGGPDGMVTGFEAMVREQMAGTPGGVAIVVSEEAKDYRPEMTWVADRLRDLGMEAACVDPRDLRFTEDGLWLDGPQGARRISLVYRFFELFDLPNVPKAELIMYSAKKDRVRVTPPFKPPLEEKLAFALFHHPALRPFWVNQLGEERSDILSRLVPQTWILDPRPIPPSAVIPRLTLAGRAVSDWRELAHAGQKERRLVIKPSGFSELAWGSRGVSIGHDLPQPEWAAALDRALDSFSTTPHVVQEFHKGRQFNLSYYDDRSEAVVPMVGRARLSPYYFVVEGRARLAGILATVCSLEKKVIHGMKDAIMAPCAVVTSDR